MEPTKDVKNLPHWTQFVMQPIEFFRANRNILDFFQMNSIKYICRYKLKNGVEDLRKAMNLIEMMIEDWEKANPVPAIPTSLFTDPRKRPLSSDEQYSH